MPVPVTPVRPDETLPDHSDVVVIGGGIAGICAALSLARRGIPVTVCEKGEIAAEQSSRNWGWCRKMGRDLRELPLSAVSLRLWRQIDAETGGATGFRTTGVAYFCRTQADLDYRADWLARAGDQAEIDSRLLGRQEMADLAPDLQGSWAGALHTPSDGQAEPWRAVPAIAELARQQGVRIFTRCAVRTIERSAGRISAVITEKGRIACNAVVLAGGAWSSLFLGNLGLRLPQLKLHSSVMRTSPVTGGPTVSATAGSFAFRQRLDGGYTVAPGVLNIAALTPDSFRFLRDFLPALRSEWKHTRYTGMRFAAEWGLPRHWSADSVSPFEKERILDPAPDRAMLEKALAEMKKTLPAFRDATILDAWAGYIDGTPDAVPVISTVPGLQGLVISTGYSGHGFGIGPGAGQLAADLVTGDRPVIDPEPFRFTRFSDGTRIRIEAGF